MDPITASVVAGLLVRYAKHAAGVAAGALDDIEKKSLQELWDTVRRRFGKDAHATATLDRVAAEPGNDLRRAALEGYLEETMRADREFATELARLAQPVTTTSVRATVKDSGAVAAGGTVSIRGTIAAGRDVVRPGRDAPT